MEGRYQFEYDERTVYASVMELVARHAVPGGCVVDLGCGFGAIAEPCREAGLVYVGFDVDPEGPEDLRRRGFEAEVCDVSEPAKTVDAIERRLGDRPLAAITLLDTLEHLTSGQATLAALSNLAARHGAVPLVMSVPNVTHVDLAAKLLVGRWDVTPTGLLDETHVAFYSPESIVTVPAAAGWRQVDANDFELDASDQHFPRDLAVLSQVTPVGSLLRAIRGGTEGGTVNQFVRAYLPAEPVEPPPPPPEGPFLSVLVRTQGRRPVTLHDTLLSLAAQTNEDYEVLLLLHDVSDAAAGAVSDLVATMPPEFRARVRCVPVHGGRRARPLNVGLAEARGRYVAILDDDDVAIANWIAEFRELAEAAPGALLRAVVARQDVAEVPEDRSYVAVTPATCPWPQTFDFVEHLWDNRSPICGFAFPRECFTEFGIAFDDDLLVLEDWDVVVRMAELCGVVCSDQATTVYRWWQSGANSGSEHTGEEWDAARKTIRARLDTRALVLPAGAAERIRDLVGAEQREKMRADGLAAIVADHERRMQEVREEYTSSTSWRFSAPVRWFGSAVARQRGRAR